MNNFLLNPKKAPASMKAACELELRRRQQERAATCYECELEATIHVMYEHADICIDDLSIEELYSLAGGRPDSCPHTREEQDINSRSHRKFQASVDLCYGDGDKEKNRQTLDAIAHDFDDFEEPESRKQRWVRGNA